MSILSITTDFTGQIGVVPRLVRISSDDSFATITTAGYLNGVNNLGYQFQPSDIVCMTYGTNVNISKLFRLSLSGLTITLVPITTAVTLPATAGDLASFSDNNGNVMDSGIAANTVLTTAIVTPDISANLIAFDITIGQAALASGGAVPLITSSGSKQYKIRQLFLNGHGTNFSGGSGDRLGQVTDGTTVFSLIPAATMQSLANSVWGATALPFPASVAINTSTVAGANLSFKYSGGTLDYTAGSLVVSGIAQRVA